MKLQVWRSTVRVLGVLVAALCVMWGCSSPSSVGAKAKGFGIEFEVTIGPGGTPQGEAKGSLPPGQCLRITYRGSAGEKLGEEIIPVPGSSQIPTGSVSQVLDFIDCPEPPTLTGPTTPWLPANRAHPVPTWREVYVMPITLTSVAGGIQGGVICHARVRCLPSQDPYFLLHPILLAGPGVAVPPTIDILFLAEVEPTLVGAQLRVAARSPILDMSLEWNDIAMFADLASGNNALPSTLPNGWYAVDTSIPGSQIRPELGAWNGGGVRIRTLAQPAFSEYAQSFQTLAF